MNMDNNSIAIGINMAIAAIALTMFHIPITSLDMLCKGSSVNEEGHKRREVTFCILFVVSVILVLVSSFNIMTILKINVYDKVFEQFLADVNIPYFPLWFFTSMGLRSFITVALSTLIIVTSIFNAKAFFETLWDGNWFYFNSLKSRWFRFVLYLIALCINISVLYREFADMSMEVILKLAGL